MSVKKGFSKKEKSKKISVPSDIVANFNYWPIWNYDTLLYPLENIRNSRFATYFKNIESERWYALVS